MSDVFTTTLVGGLIILLVLVLAFGGLVDFQTQPFGRTFVGSGFIRTSDPIASLSGITQVESVDSFNQSEQRFNVDIGNQIELKTFQGKRIFNGLLFGDESLKFKITNPQVLHLKVAKTNNYGELIVKANDKVIYQNESLVGEYVFDIGENKESVIEIAAGSSGWKIWAPAIYELDEVEVASGQTIKQEFSFNVNYEKFAYGELDFSFDRAEGSIAVILNGRELYVGTPRKLTLDKSVILPGNKLVLESRGLGRFKGQMTAKLFDRTKAVKTAKLSFMMNQTQYNQLSQRAGQIAFDVIDVSRPGGFAITVKSNNSTVLLRDYGKAEKLSNYFRFGQPNVAIGTNEVTIEALEDASFNLANLRIIV